jgi:chemotaxis protein CheY-P-specific phosphatase CheC
MLLGLVAGALLTPNVPSASAAPLGKSSLGDCVWGDNNNNALQNTPAESGINGVLMLLYENGVNGASAGVFPSTGYISSTVTGPSNGALDSSNVCADAGYYDFNVDGQKTYFVVIAPENFDPGGPLYDYVWTSRFLIGTNESADGIYYQRTMALQEDFNGADFGFVKVDARISLTPLNDTNKVGDPHTFTATVQQKIGSGNWTNVANGTIVTPTVVDSNNNPVTLASNACGNTGTTSGQCTFSINSTIAEVYTANATTTPSITVPITGGPAKVVTRTRATGTALNTAAGGSGAATKTYVNLRISITPQTDTNKVGDSHTFTVKVEQQIGTGNWTPVAGVSPAVTVSPAPTSTTDNCVAPGVTNASGECTVVINSNVAQVYTANASVTVSVSGQSITRSTLNDAANMAAGGTDDAVKTYVNLRISITPQTDTNKVGDSHTFTVKVEQQIGTGNWTPVAGVSPAVTVSPAPTSTTNNCVAPGVTNASGECTVVINSNVAQVYTANASVTVSVSGQSITRSTLNDAANIAAGGTDDAVKTYVDLRISITPQTDTNKVGDSHTFTVKVEQKIGTGNWTPVAGVSPAVTVSPAPTSTTNNCVAPGVTNASGECTVVINSTVAQVYTANASVTVSVSGQSITRSTLNDAANIAAGGTDDAVKTYVNLRISITPQTDTNKVGDSHTFTVKVEQQIGTGNWTPVAGVSPAVTVSPAPTSTTDNCAAPGVTNASGECTVVINSSVAQVYTANASVTVSVSGQSITRSTLNDAANIAAGGTDDAVKTYVNLRISITPQTDTNPVGAPHTFTVKVEQQIGTGNWTPVAGVSPAVTVSPAPTSTTNNCAAPNVTNASGECTVVINSNVVQVYTANASVTVSVSSQSITRSTTNDAANIAAGGSGPATKIYVAGTIGDFVWWDIDKDGRQDNGEPGIPGVTVLLFNNGTCTGSSIASDETDANGEYLFTGLGAGTYCVQIAPGEVSVGGADGDTLVGWIASPANAAGVPDDEDSDGIDDTSVTPKTYKIQTITIDPVNGPQIDLTNDFGFYKNSGYTITKVQITDPNDAGVAVNTLVEFDITIVNTGTTHLSVVPLEDDYNPVYLDFVDATLLPLPGTTLTPDFTDTTNGFVRWNDITGAGQLAPGASIIVRVKFQAMADTTSLTNGQAPCNTPQQTCNEAWVRNSTDPAPKGPTVDPDGPNGPLGDNNPPGDQEKLEPKNSFDGVKIINPTSVTLAGSVMEAQADRMILSWSTINETEIAGFNIYRLSANSEWTKLNSNLIDAQKIGQPNGASYSFTDMGQTFGVNVTYKIEVVMVGGRTESEILSKLYIFLPSTQR